MFILFTKGPISLIFEFKFEKTSIPFAVSSTNILIIIVSEYNEYND